MIRSDTIHWHAHVRGSNDPLGQESIKNELHIHSIPNQETYELIKQSDGVIDDHIYFVDGEDSGSANINITMDNDSKLYVLGVPSGDTSGKTISYNSGVYIQNGILYGAAWNDYAEYREIKEKIEAGRVVCETGKGDLILATERLQPGANIVSDTFGFAIGYTENCRTPLAVSGRVLAYPFEEREEFAAGDPVCAGPLGTVSKMSREEVREYPDRILGTVSEIPNYDKWNETEVKGRIWIKVK